MTKKDRPVSNKKRELTSHLQKKKDETFQNKKRYQKRTLKKGNIEIDPSMTVSLYRYGTQEF